MADATSFFTRVEMAQPDTFIQQARTFLLNDLQSILLKSPWVTRKACNDKCGLFSHLPGLDDLAKFRVLNETNPRHMTVDSPLRNTMLFPVHFGISFNYETVEFVWDETGDEVENGYFIFFVELKPAYNDHSKRHINVENERRQKMALDGHVDYCKVAL